MQLISARTVLPALTLCCLSMAGVATAQDGHRQAGAHVHGTANLALALDGSTLTVELESPLDSIVGFEHPPQTEVQEAELAAAVSRLRDPASVIRTPAAAGCTGMDADIDLPHGFAVENGATKAGHAGTDGMHDHDHEDHGHGDHADGHAEVHATYLLTCRTPSALTGADLTLFAQFPRVQSVRAAFLSDKIQKADTLTRDRASFAWQ